MKILVVDDKQQNRDSALETLKEHEVTVASSFDEAREIVTGDVPMEKVQKALGRGRGPITIDDAFRAMRKEMAPKFDFEVVLLDLMMPVSGGLSDTVPDARWSKEEAPFGFPLMIEIAKRKGDVVKRIAICSDVNHHKHVMSAALDALGGDYSGSYTTINGVPCHFVHAWTLDDGTKDWQFCLRAALSEPGQDLC